MAIEILIVVQNMWKNIILQLTAHKILGIRKMLKCITKACALVYFFFLYKGKCQEKIILLHCNLLLVIE